MRPRPRPVVVLWSVMLVLSLTLGATRAFAQPANDVCLNAITLGLNTPLSGSNEGAGFEMRIQSSNCALTQAGIPPQDVWYRFTPETEGVYEIRTRGDEGLPTYITVPWLLYAGCPDIAAPHHTVQVCASDAGSGSAAAQIRLRAHQFVAFSVSTTPGTTGAFDVEVVPVPGAPAAPANDLCPSATMIALGTPVAGTNVGASMEASGCVYVDYARPPGDVWYRFVPAATGLYRFRVQGQPGVAPGIGQALGCPSATGATGFLVCAADFFGSGVAEITCLVTAGETALLSVSSASGTAGSFTLTAELVAETPANDQCAAATMIVLGQEIEGSNVAATGAPVFDSGLPCGNLHFTGAGADDVFYVFTPAVTGDYSFSTCDGDGFTSTTFLDTVLSVHAACPATPANTIACNDDQPLIESDGLCTWGYLNGQFSRLAGVHLIGGVSYYVRVAGKGVLDPQTFQTIIGGRQGAFKLRVQADAPRDNPPGNDLCGSAEAIALGQTLRGSTVYASGEPWPCGEPNAASFDAWYRLTSALPGRNTFEVRVTSWLSPLDSIAPDVAVYAACSGVPRTCGRAAGSFGVSTVAVGLNENESVLIRVGKTGVQFDFDIAVLGATPTPAETTCAAPTIIAAGETVAGSTLGLPDMDALACALGVTRVQWYMFTPPESAYYRIELRDPLVDGAESSISMALMGGCGDAPQFCSSTLMPCFGCPIVHPRPLLLLPAGVPVLINIGFNGYVSGTYALEVSQPIPPPPPPANDLCVNAQAVALAPGGFFTDTAVMVSATPDLGGSAAPCLFGGNVGSGVWYAVTPAVTGKLFAYANRSDGVIDFNQALLAVYSGTCESPVLEGCFFSGGTAPVVSAGETYLVLVYYLAGVPIDFDNRVEVRLAVEGVPHNDVCTQAAPIAAVPATIRVNNWGASEDPNPASCASILPGQPSMPNTVWYALRTRTAGTLTLTVDSGIERGTYYDLFLDTFVAVYAAPCSALEEIACDCNWCGLSSPGISAYDAQAGLQAGRNYVIALGSWSTDGLKGGPIELRVQYDGEVASACTADFNQNGSVTIDDLFLYLNAWFSGDGRADVNGVGGVTIDDLFLYLNAYFTGCP